MSLDPGTKLGPYEILASIGAGGMGEVYKARDTRLDRIVAIKVCAEEFSERFEREARAISSLNHPHICQLYDVGPNYLVMEYIEGQPLKGPLPVEKAVEYAGQILRALETAHRHAVVHRDLKPANILVTKAGIKLLDFGLAKKPPAAAAAANAEHTVTMALTAEHSIVGTLQYMSPEQIEGKPQDARTDIFSFGCVLYEMLTGHRAFEGKSASSVMAAVLATEPAPVSQAQHTTPHELDRVVSVCLAKDPEDRWQSARDLRRALEAAVGPRAVEGPRRLPWLWKAAVAGGLIAALAAGWVAGYLRRPGNSVRSYRLQIAPPTGARFMQGASGGSAISPNGQMLAFVAESSRAPSLWIRSLDSLQPRDLPGTEGASYPFWSPDGRSLGFFSGGKVKRVEIGGGSPVTIGDAPAPRGGSWNSDGVIVIAPFSSGELKSIPATGGPSTSVTELDPAHQEITHRWPQFLPGGRQFLYFVRSPDPRYAGAYLGSLDRPKEKTLLVNTTVNAIYAAGSNNQQGYLLWLRGENLTSQRFDPLRGQLSGDMIAMTGDASRFGVAINLAGISASDEGTLVYGGGNDRNQLAWFSRDGRLLQRIGQPDIHQAIRISPDGKQVAVAMTDVSGNLDVWKIDLLRGGRTRLTFGNHGYTAVWSPDGKHLAHHGPAAGHFRLFRRDASGAGKEEALSQTAYDAYMSDWSPDGQVVLYNEVAPQTANDIWILQNPLGAANERKAYPFLQSSFREYQARFSPDGAWIAYTSEESGREDVYVQRFPSTGAKWLVSSGGGAYPVWRRDGKELFYRALDGSLTAIPVRLTANGPEIGPAAALLRIPASAGIFQYPYDVSPDGQQILTFAADDKGDQPLLTVVGNWDMGLKR